MKDNIKDIEESFSKLNSTLTELTDKIKPLMDFDDIEKEINDLKDVIPEMTKEKDKYSTMTYNGETLNIGGLLAQIFKLVEKYDSNEDLGKSIRKLYDNHVSNNSNTKK